MCLRPKAFIALPMGVGQARVELAAALSTTADFLATPRRPHLE